MSQFAAIRTWLNAALVLLSISGCTPLSTSLAPVPKESNLPIASTSQPPTALPTPETATVPASTSDNTGVTIAEAAKLSSDQVQSLLGLAKQAKRNEPGRDFRIIVPTYIPSGFAVQAVDTDARTGKIGRPSYNVQYQNSNTGCSFSIQGLSGGAGDGMSDHQEVKAFSEALGIVVLAVMKSDRRSGSSSVRLLNQPHLVHGRGYYFSSGCKNSLNVPETIKVVESLQYITSSQAKARTLEDIKKDADRLRNKFDFPLSLCGDSTSDSNRQWYPVFLDGTSLGNAQQYCKNAEDRGGSDRLQNKKIQVGSFSSRERALDFAKAIGGRVGKPDK